MASIFTRIINGEIPCYKVAENGRFFAFLDISPLKAGHTLIVPKKEIDYLFDLEDNDLEGIMVFSKKVAAAIKKAYPCNRIGVAVLGLEVPHAHIHLVPMDNMEDVNFKNPKLKFSPEEFREIAANISKNL
ncbi:MAG: HIT family protein [Bacteroidetes bacterium]|nr:HIT family protein [Bacteroidota bacterium]